MTSIPTSPPDKKRDRSLDGVEREYLNAIDRATAAQDNDTALALAAGLRLYRHLYKVTP